MTQRHGVDVCAGLVLSPSVDEAGLYDAGDRACNAPEVREPGAVERGTGLDLNADEAIAALSQQVAFEAVLGPQEPQVSLLGAVVGVLDRFDDSGILKQ